MPGLPVVNAGTLGDVLIPTINRLQDIFSQVTVDLKLSLPQVAVVGSQSSGKSSVLEGLVGRDFLPRGSDIVTRRPLVLQLVKTASTSNGHSEWGEFLHAPGKLFYEFDKIRQEIQAETDRVVGTNKNVSDKPIRLKIFSPHVLTMTLVDLPGMTRVPVGDQPSNIEARIREMVLDHIRPPSVIILAVSPANADLANSDAIQLARMVDPEGLRTIGVLTKLDIMDRGTSAAHILRNQHIPLRLGYVAVVNRSQEDINKAMSVPDARKAEERFFMSHPEYREVMGQCGVNNLARRLNALLVEHIRSLLPGLRRAVNDALEIRQAELRSLGNPLPVEGKSSKGAYLLQLLCEYSDRFAAMLEGRHQDLSTQRLSGGARIRAVFNSLYAPALRDLVPNKDVSDEAILTVIKNGAGVAGNLLVPQEPFELLVRKSVTSLLGPSLACKEAVHEELLSIAHQACPPELARFPALQRTLAAVVLDFIHGNADPADRMIRELVDCEHDFINCDHPDFIGGRGAIRAVMQERSMRAAAAGAGALRHPGAKDAGDASSRESGGAAGTLGLHHKGKAASGSASAADMGKAGSGLSATGLKGIPDASPPPTDELLSRTRRRSDGGGMFNGLGSDSVLTLGAGTPPSPGGGYGAAFSTYSYPLTGSSLRDGGYPGHTTNNSSAGLLHHGTASPSGHQPSAPAAAVSSSSWFSWFRSGDAAGRSSAANGYSSEEAPRSRPHPGADGMVAGSSGRAAVRTEQEEVEVEVIRRLVDSYFNIVKRNLSDTVPKAIMHFMVNNTKRGLQQHLIQALYKDELLEELLSEREDVVVQRKAAQQAVKALQEAGKALAELPNELGSTSVSGAIVPVGGGVGGRDLGDNAAFLSSGNITVASAVAMGGPLSPLERTATMAAAARIASAATASLTGHNEAMFLSAQQHHITAGNGLL